jgi:hypothetical protein
MTSQDTSQPLRSNHAQMVEAASLIANIYGERGKLQSLIDYLVQSLVVTPQLHGTYANMNTGTLLRHFDPSTASAHDTTIIQMALNVPGKAETAWEAMREQLEAILTDNERFKNVWGYTLIYQAELAESVPSGAVLTTLLPAVRRLHSALFAYPQVLARSDMPEGISG